MMLLALLLQAAAPQPPMPPPLHGGPEPTICPVGGEQFTAFQPGVWSTYGERPDGKPYSYLPLPFPLPECPSNKLVVFDDFTSAERGRLAALIATPEYLALARTDTRFYRAWWLATKLNRPVTQRLWLLLTAGWEVKGGEMTSPAQPDLARRYDEAFARGVAALPSDASAKERVALLARGANAWRELGRFHEAKAMLAQARTALGSLADSAGGWGSYLDALAPVIARRDASVEPHDVIPAREAARRCRAATPPLLTNERKLCALPTIANER